MNSLYYPILERRDITEYYKAGCEFYATYNCKTNYNNVALDCKYRCVYCDAHIDECGGEPFSLDHFRPIDVFGDKFDGIFKIHPFNLHLSCQKCNVLKTNDWKGCLDTPDGPTFQSGKGYIDRFQVDIKDYLDVNADGYLQCNNSLGPAKYIIGKLLLNRTNRVYMRKLREVKTKAALVHSMLIRRQEKILNEWTTEKLTGAEVKQEMQSVIALFNKFNNLGLFKKDVIS